MQVRLFRPEDVEQVAQLFHDTVRKVNIQDYCQDQVEAWSPDDIYFRNWSPICSKFTYVAAENSRVIGFGELEVDGHIDCFYVHYQYQRQGVGSKIYQAIEIKARELNLIRLFTDASITAKPFFIHQGFNLVKRQQVLCRGQTLINFLMEKRLTIEEY